MNLESFNIMYDTNISGSMYDAVKKINVNFNELETKILLFYVCMLKNIITINSITIMH